MEPNFVELKDIKADIFPPPPINKYERENSNLWIWVTVGGIVAAGYLIYRLRTMNEEKNAEQNQV